MRIQTGMNRERERGGKQDSEIVIIADTNENLITPRQAAQAVLPEAECRGQRAARVRLRGDLDERIQSAIMN